MMQGKTTREKMSVRPGNRQLDRTIAIVALSFVTLAVAAVIGTTGTAAAGGTIAGDPTRGKTLFEKRCGGCHSLDADKEGPRLRNVYGRKAGSVPSFRYSDTLKEAPFTWDAAQLNRWLTDTESVVPDNNMDFHVPNADERTDIIEFLRVTSAK